jgi:lipoprotein signal peptidase
MAERSYRGLFWGLALTGAALDQVSKYGVFRWLYNDGRGDQHAVVPGAFEVLAQYTGARETGTGLLAALRTLGGGDVLPKVNHGALFGLLSEHTDLANALFAGVSLLAAVAITFWGSRAAAARDRSLSVALGLILAGTLGKLYDRLVFNGVRDFLHLHYRDSFDWPVFNVADVCLVLGAALLLLQAFFGRAPAAEAPAASETAPPRQEMAEAR